VHFLRNYSLPNSRPLQNFWYKAYPKNPLNPQNSVQTIDIKQQFNNRLHTKRTLSGVNVCTIPKTKTPIQQANRRFYFN
jgi:hypothetical protein